MRMDGSLSETKKGSHKKHKTEPQKGTNKNPKRMEKLEKMTTRMTAKGILFVPFVSSLCLFVMQ